MSQRTMERVVKSDLGLQTLVKRRVQLLTASQRQKRLERARVILNKLKSGKDKVLIFSDEKDYHVDKHHNRRNSRYISESPKVADPTVKYVGRQKHPAKAMMLGYVDSDSKAFPPIWVKGTVRKENYKRMLSQTVIPTLDRTYGKGNYVWVQDGAPSHTSKVVQNYLSNKLGSGGFWSKSVWPPNLPNLNTLDFSLWDWTAQEAQANYHSSVDSLKMSVEAAWARMPAAIVLRSCTRFRARIEAG